MGKRQPVRGQAAKWCVCGEWFASERDEREHVGQCPGPMVKPGVCYCGEYGGGKHTKSARCAPTVGTDRAD